MFGVALDRIGEKLPGFMDRVNEEEDEQSAVEKCLQKGNQLLGTIKHLMGEMVNKRHPADTWGNNNQRYKEAGFYQNPIMTTNKEVNNN